jgi:hypothetical protein
MLRQMSGSVLSSGRRLIRRKPEQEVLAGLLSGVPGLRGVRGSALVVRGAAASATRRCSSTRSRLRAGFGLLGRPGSSSDGALDAEHPWRMTNEL